MNTKWMLLLLFAVPFAVIAQSVKRVPVETKMEQVTVFMKGAQVKRTAKQTITTGKQEIVFTGISTDIEKQSVQVKADGKLTILSVRVQRDFLKEQEVREEIKTVQNKSDQLNEKITLTSKMLEVFKQEESMIIKNQEISGSTVTLKPEELRLALDFQRSRLAEVLKQQLSLQKEIDEMQKERAKLLNQLTEMNRKFDLSTNEIVVLADVKENATVSFEITYLVQKAGWYPSYNIRVKDVVSNLQLEMNANVYQTSGENWNNIKLVLSTGNPNENNSKPIISPWFISYYDAQMSNTMKQWFIGGTDQMLTGRITDDKGVPVPGASVVIKGTYTGTVTDANGFYKIKANGTSQRLTVSSVGYNVAEFVAGTGFMNVALKQTEQNLNEVVVVGYGTQNDLEGKAPGIQIRGASSYKSKSEPLQITTTFQPITIQYEIEEITTVNNDGKTNTLSINETSIAAYYEYYSAPKLDEAAYLTAKINNWQDLNLIPGETNLFYEGTYLGKSYLDLSTGSDTLSLSLGVDKGITVKRTMLKEFSNKKFLGSNRTDTRQFEITVRNNKNVPVNLVIEDQFPISTIKEIEVDDLKYEGAKLNDETKVFTWNNSIEPKQSKKMQFSYSVKYPKEKKLQLE
ncbi:MAG: mucoidy inhibitor MuiA family protein [Lacibacter sp.]